MAFALTFDFCRFLLLPNENPKLGTWAQIALKHEHEIMALLQTMNNAHA